MCMHVIIVLFYQNHQSVYKSKPSNDFMSYNSQILVSIWGAAPRPPAGEFTFHLNTPASDIFLHL